jgi:glycine cleavage system H protein
MSQLRFTKDHEWVRLDGDIAVCGITDYAQKALGDVVYVELPIKGRQVKQGDQAAVVESVKAASEVYAPMAGEVIAVNDNLATAPAQVNAAPTGDGWFFKIKPTDKNELNGLMDEKTYLDYVKGLAS